MSASTYQITEDQVETFERDGVVHIPGAIDAAMLDRLRDLVAEDMAAPSGMVKNINEDGATGFFFGDTFVCHHIPGFLDAMFASPLAAMA